MCIRDRAGIIQLFEVVFELSWKLMKDYLEASGFRVSSPRETIKQAYQVELIDDGHIWMDALADRNLTVHTYDEALAKRMTADIVQIYFPELEKLLSLIHIYPISFGSTGSVYPFRTAAHRAPPAR